MKTARMHRLSLYIVILMIYMLVRFFDQFSPEKSDSQLDISLKGGGVLILGSMVLTLILTGCTFLLYLSSVIVRRCCEKQQSLQSNETPKPDNDKTCGQTTKGLAFLHLGAGIAGLIQLFIVSLIYSVDFWSNYFFTDSSTQHQLSFLLDFSTSLIMFHTFSGFVLYDLIKMMVQHINKSRKTPVLDRVPTDLEQNSQISLRDL